MSLLNILSNDLLEIETQISLISHYHQSMIRDEIEPDAFRRFSLYSVDSIEREQKILESIIKDFQNISMSLSTNAFCVNALVRVKKQSNRIRVLLNQATFNQSDLQDALKRISSEVKAILSTVCMDYERKISRLANLENRMNCFEKAIRAIRFQPPPRFKQDLSIYIRESEFQVKLLEDDRAVLNKTLLAFPGVARFIISLIDVARRISVVHEMKTYNPEDPDAILPLSNELRELVDCVERYDFWGTQKQNLKKDFLRFFNDGGWLEAYTYLMVGRAGCSTRLLNTIISNSDNTKMEADILACYRRNHIVYECKDRSQDLSQSDIKDIEGTLESTRRLGIDKIVFVICCGQENKDDVRDIILSKAEATAANSDVLFLENEGFDNLDYKIRRSLVEE